VAKEGAVQQKKYTDLVDMLQKSISAHGERPSFGTKRAGRWEWISYRELGEMVDRCRGGLAARGVGRGDVVAIIASNRLEWAVCAYATYGLGARFVPMYENQLTSDWRYIIEDSETKILFVSTRDIFGKVRDWPEEIDTLDRVYCLAFSGDREESFEALLREGDENPAEVASLDPDEVCGFIYTSGTTGKPKGVLLTHANFIANINDAHMVFPLEPTDCVVSFLPWAHSLGQTVELHLMLSWGAALAPAESIAKLVENFAEVRPTVMVSVPRIFNKIYDGVHKKMEEEGGVKKLLFKAALENEGNRRKLAEADRTSLLVETKHRFYDKLVFSKIRARFGGRLKFAFSGGAALSPDVAEFIDKIGIMVFEGYGLTETAPVVSANYPGNRKIGSVGKPLPSVTVKIDQSMVKDESDDGEIVVYGPNVMKGYHKLADATAEVMTEDGGFRTGDRGHLDSDGYLYITGRIKEQYKLTNGKYVVPAPLEEQLQLSPYIVQVFIDGTNKPFNVALVVPDQEAVTKWAREQDMQAGFEELLKKPELKKLIEKEIAKYGKELKGYEKPKKIALIGEEFTTENGMLTPTLKIKRRKVVEKYKDLLDSLWEG
jgi:long-chain acyl-CoA synthetase